MSDSRKKESERRGELTQTLQESLYPYFLNWQHHKLATPPSNREERIIRLSQSPTVCMCVFICVCVRLCVRVKLFTLQKWNSQGERCLVCQFKTITSNSENMSQTRLAPTLGDSTVKNKPLKSLNQFLGGVTKQTPHQSEEKGISFLTLWKAHIHTIFIKQNSLNAVYMKSFEQGDKPESWGSHGWKTGMLLRETQETATQLRRGRPSTLPHPILLCPPPMDTRWPEPSQTGPRWP